MMTSNASPTVRETTKRLSADAWWILIARILRSAAYGALATVLSIHLERIGLEALEVGAVLTSALVGSLAANIIWSLTADRFGRRRTVVVMALVMAVSGFIFAITNEVWLLVITAFAGTISATASEVGPFQSIDQAILPQVVSPAHRTWAFSIYNMAAYIAAAIGSLLAGFAGSSMLPGILGDGLQIVFVAYGLAGVANALLFGILSPAVELSRVDGASRYIGLDRSKAVVFKLSALFAIDAFAGGLVVQSVVAYWFHLRWDLDLMSLGSVFFAVNLVAGFSMLLAPVLAERIGLLNTMVWTHIPSNIMLMLVPLAPSVEIAIALFVGRMLVSQMDVPARQSYMMAIVDPAERVPAAGITNVARAAASAISPVISTAAFASASLGLPFVVAGLMKIGYDLIIWQTFRNVRPKEEIERLERRRANKR
ncbi:MULTISPECIES: MFS transporter [Rhizobium]|uniref:MFS transporter n=2 Tax=Rhizobium TaxID=379 RepID=UPI001A930BFE|nr:MULTISPECIES: MFS transporter [Rhizobium]MBY3143460.1 MFS transporter [Rhizobium laguerreae]MBY3157758.1 MFS transporter [Rhizobium laguerreae]MBY3266586.1 MFS transporter [Rhizobium laguerreae]MBY3341588.1 MFS transporter [Rhizobium laguerreae]MBY5558323.1 MFS transporter [Rhizobium leguminosarum]